MVEDNRSDNKDPSGYAKILDSCDEESAAADEHNLYLNPYLSILPATQINHWMLTPFLWINMSTNRALVKHTSQLMANLQGFISKIGG